MVPSESKNVPIPRSLNLQKQANLKPLQSLSKWTPKRMTAMSMSKRNVRWPALRSVLGPILSCFLRLRAFYFYACTDWHQSGKYRKLLVSSAIFINKNRNQWQPRTLHSLCINARRASNAREPFSGPISRVNLPLFTLIECKGKVSETFILRSWTWVKKKKKIRHLKRNGNKKERKCDNRNVAETWRKRDPSMKN